jgi:type II secretion system protein N
MQAGSAADVVRRRLPRRLPRPLLWIGVPLAGLLLIALFVYLNLPWERFRSQLARQLEAASGARVSLGGLAPSFGATGPGLLLEQLRLEWPDASALAFDQARLRPAFSLAWLRGNPALAIAASAGQGQVEGTLVWGASPAWDGDLRQLELEHLPLEPFAPGVALTGLGTLDADVRFAAEGPEGTLGLEAQEGSLAHPGLPIALPFQTLTGVLNLGGEQTAEIVSLALRGPLLDADLEGTIGRAPAPGHEPLRLSLRIALHDPALAGALEPLGVPFDSDGSAKLQILGTLARPEIRQER